MGKAERTREQLRTVALRLFDEQGFDETTVSAIAAEAGVSAMTFFRHFPTKEQVVLDDPYDPAIALAVAAQRADLGALERVRRGLLTAWGGITAGEDDDLQTRLRIGAKHPGLRARMRENNARTEAAITQALVEDGVPPFDAAVAAAAVLGALTAALLAWAVGGGPPALGSAVTRALALLGAEPAR